MAAPLPSRDGAADEGWRVTDLKLTGDETAEELIKKLVALRLWARRVVVMRRKIARLLEANERIRDRIPANVPEGAAAVMACAGLSESKLQLDFAEIEIGQYLRDLCVELDAKCTPEQVCEAISANRTSLAREDVNKHGAKAGHLIWVFNLENSATKADGIEIRPLNWCHTRAFMQLLQTSDVFARTVHDGANEFFDGAFGAFREKPLTERLIGRPA